MPSGVFTGKFKTERVTGEFINHYYVMANNWQELWFIILDTYLRQAETSGSLIKI